MSYKKLIKDLSILIKTMPSFNAKNTGKIKNTSGAPDFMKMVKDYDDINNVKLVDTQKQKTIAEFKKSVHQGLKYWVTARELLTTTSPNIFIAMFAPCPFLYRKVFQTNPSELKYVPEPANPYLIFLEAYFQYYCSTVAKYYSDSLGACDKLLFLTYLSKIVDPPKGNIIPLIDLTNSIYFLLFVYLDFGVRRVYETVHKLPPKCATDENTVFEELLLTNIEMFNNTFSAYLLTDPVIDHNCFDTEVTTVIIE